MHKRWQHIFYTDPSTIIDRGGICIVGINLLGSLLVEYS